MKPESFACPVLRIVLTLNVRGRGLPCSKFCSLRLSPIFKSSRDSSPKPISQNDCSQKAIIIMRTYCDLSGAQGVLKSGLPGGARVQSDEMHCESNVFDFWPVAEHACQVRLTTERSSFHLTNPWYCIITEAEHEERTKFLLSRWSINFPRAECTMATSVRSTCCGRGVTMWSEQVKTLACDDGGR